MDWSDVIRAQSAQRYFRPKGTFACAAGKWRLIRMSEAGILGANVWKILGRRWTLAILQNLAPAVAMRFSELKKSIPGVSGTMLSERLLELEAEGLLNKKIYSSVPPRVEYSLTASAEELMVLIREVRDWNARMTSQRSTRESIKYGKSVVHSGFFTPLI